MFRFQSSSGWLPKFTSVPSTPGPAASRTIATRMPSSITCGPRVSVVPMRRSRPVISAISSFAGASPATAAVSASPMRARSFSMYASSMPVVRYPPPQMPCVSGPW